MSQCHTKQHETTFVLFQCYIISRPQEPGWLLSFSTRSPSVSTIKPRRQHVATSEMKRIENMVYTGYENKLFGTRSFTNNKPTLSGGALPFYHPFSNHTRLSYQFLMLKTCTLNSQFSIRIRNIQ